MAKKTIQQPVPKASENAADALMAALTNIGHAIPTVREANRTGLSVKGDRQSRFFFRPTRSWAEDIKRRQQQIKPKEVEIIDQQVETRRKTYSKELPPQLNRNLEAVREFWLKSITPQVMASIAGADQAYDVVQRTLGEDVELDRTALNQFKLMVHRGMTIKLANYVARYLKLPDSAVSELLDTVTIKRPQREIVYMNADPDSNRRSRAEPKSHPPQSQPKEKDNE